MAAPVDYTDTGPELSALGAITQAREPFALDQDFTDQTSGIGETAGATFMLDTVVGTVLDEIRTRSEYRSENADPYFNPYSYFSENSERFDKDMPWLDYFVRNGDFHSVTSAEEFEAVSAQIGRELGRRDIVANGGFLGTGAGMLLSFMDVTTAIPVVGLVGKGGVAVKAGIGALQVGAQTAAQEGYLQSSQYARTATESLLNIGVSTVLGGGVGAFQGALYKSNVLHPRHPQNPLNLSTAIPTIEVQSLSAAAAPAERATYADSVGLGLLDRVGHGIGTPAAVARDTASVSPETASIMERLSRSGMATKENERGVANFNDSAEEIWTTDYESASVATLETIDGLWFGLNKELGASAIRSRNVAENIPGLSRMVGRLPVTRNDWDRHLVFRLNNPEYSTGNAVVDKAVSQAAGEVKRYFDFMFNRGVQLGLFTPDQKLDNYFVQRWVSAKINENPAQFEAMLLDKFSKRPDTDWLRDVYDITPEEFAKLPDTVEGLTDKYKTAEGKVIEVRAGTKPPVNAELVERAISKREVLSTWGDEVSADRLRILEKQAEVAAFEAESFDYLFRRSSKFARAVDKTKAAAELMEAKAAVRESEAALTRLRERKAQLEAESRALVDAASAARQTTLDRQLQLSPVQPDTAILNRLEETLGLQPSKSPERTVSRAEAEGRARESARRLMSIDRRLRAAEERHARLAEAAEARNLAVDKAKRLRKELATELRARKVAARVAKVENRKAARLLKAAQTRKSVSEQVNEITRTLQNHGDVPNGMLLFKAGSDERIAASGRVKHRGIDLTPDELREFIDAGYLDTDIGGVMMAYTRDIGGRLAILEKFGNVDLKPQVREVQDHFAKLKERATGAEREKLAAMEKKAIDTITVLRNRVLGIDGLPDNPESFLMYMNRTARAVNFLRFMGGTVLSSITDLATSALTNGGMGATLSRFSRRLYPHAKELKDPELRALLVGSENSLVLSRVAKNMGLDDLEWVRGYGNGTTRKVTAAVEGSLRGLSEKMSMLNGMTQWNRHLRYLAGQVQLTNIIKDAKKIAKGDTLPAHRVTEYARFGMDIDELKEIAEQIAKHGERNDAGLIDPNAKAWDGDRGAYLRRRMLTLLKRATQEAVIAPTAMDIPPFMSRPAGRILTQFQTFGFAAVNKYLRNLRYKAVNGQGFDVLMSMTYATAMGAMAYTLKEGVIRQQPLTDKPGQWVFEAVDRSGLAAWMSPFANAGMKLGAPAMNSLGIDWFEQPSRYRAATWYSALLGPSVSLGDDVFGTMTSLSQGDLDAAGTKALRLVPFRNVFYLEALVRLANGIDN